MLHRSLVLLAAAVLLCVVPPASTARASRPDAGRERTRSRPHARTLPAVEMQHLTTHESFVLRPDENGRLGGKRLRGLKHFLRCHHTGREHAMAPRLAELLYATAHHFGDRPITVVAGYRAPKVARKKGNTRSPHKKGVACDFRVDGVKVTEVRDYVRRAFQGVGVGYYPNSGFIHLDVGRKQSAFWIDYSGPGERADYSADPDGDIRNGVADPAPPTVADGEGDAEASPEAAATTARTGDGADETATAGVGAARKLPALPAAQASPGPLDEGGAALSPDRTPIE
jgi:uncharacterized protein YcbK (DUF882 family)